MSETRAMAQRFLEALTTELCENPEKITPEMVEGYSKVLDRCDKLGPLEALEKKVESLEGAVSIIASSPGIQLALEKGDWKPFLQ